jgi:Flp pilus assembly pilin Flp
MRNNGQSIIEYAIVLGVVAVVLASMSLYFRRGIQSVVKAAADEAGNQEDAEDINPVTGTSVFSEVRRQSETTYRQQTQEGGDQTSAISSTGIATGTSTSVSTQEK